MNLQKLRGACILWLEAAQADPVHSFSEYRVSARANDPFFHSFALGGYSLPVSHVHSTGERRGWGSRCGCGVPAPPRATRSAPKAWALRARASTFALTPMHAHVASWWWGCRRRRALRAARDARCKARFALLPRARVGRGGPDLHFASVRGNASAPPQHVQCKSERRVAGCAGCALTVLTIPAQLRLSIERASERAFFQVGARRR